MLRDRGRSLGDRRFGLRRRYVLRWARNLRDAGFELQQVGVRLRYLVET